MSSGDEPVASGGRRGAGAHTVGGVSDPVAAAEALAPRLAERAPAYDRQAAFPAADIEDLRGAGLLGLMAPQSLGGLGASFTDYTRVAVELARGSGPTALVFNMHASVTGALAHTSDQLARELGAPESYFVARDRALADAAEGAMYGVAITERGVGSRLSKVATTYAAEDGGYRLSGHKAACSGAGHLDAYLLAARAADAGPDDDPRVSHFLVGDGDGLDVEDAWDPLGMRATVSNGFTLDAWVPADALVGGVEGLAVLLAYALPQWLVASYAAVYVGVALAIRDAAAAECNERVVSGERGGLGNLAAVRARLGRVDAGVEAAAATLERAAERVDAAPGEPETNRWVYRAKLLAGDAATEAAVQLTEACGLGALRHGAALERLFRDARSGAVMPPSSDVAADYLGTAALGRDPVTGTDVRPW
jgi:alkylation response protein AidB-like acyl-CoA dehydrogenase